MSRATATNNPLQFLDEALAQIRAEGLYRKLRVLAGEQRAAARFDSKDVINLSSNNYLGLTTHPKLREAALRALKELGVGSGSVRTIAGTMEIHMELERRIAAFKKTEASVVFQSGFAANAGTVAAILGKDDLILSDELNHASIIDGARLSRATIRVFPHRNPTELGRLLEETASVKRRLVITDGVFSMDGDIAPMPEIAALARAHGAIMMVDDAHASGVLGKAGRGTVDHFGLHGQVDIQVGTLSKAIGVLGGYVAGTRSLIEYLYHRARPFLFSTSHPPAVAAACIAAFDVLEAEPERIERLWSNTKRFKDGLKRLGFNTGISETPITPIFVGEADLAMKFSDRLFDRGLFAQGIGYPTVPKGKARLRTIVTATHTEEELDRALSILEEVGRGLEIIR
ncbi:MAG: glycine C-acetyltransferase [Candidatus Eisenbacteria bacterium]|uniref:8-amino-7-ketopelargonate synthase n=1 Tax=Eiseniibacteriota bacterium TaxID=2212470 RepID=A0A538TSM7_UNCEI|nr:MAG: glycine C-acetyltransferase [Candidatus Eisenbacteria bacterium]